MALRRYGNVNDVMVFSADERILVKVLEQEKCTMREN